MCIGDSNVIVEAVTGRFELDDGTDPVSAFDIRDVNVNLTLKLTRHSETPGFIQESPPYRANTSILGQHRVTYTVTDEVGNERSEQRFVTVRDSTPPDITICLGNNVECSCPTAPGYQVPPLELDPSKAYQLEDIDFGSVACDNLNEVPFFNEDSTSVPMFNFLHVIVAWGTCSNTDCGLERGS